MSGKVANVLLRASELALGMKVQPSGSWKDIVTVIGIGPDTHEGYAPYTRITFDNGTGWSFIPKDERHYIGNDYPQWGLVEAPLLRARELVVGMVVVHTGFASRRPLTVQSVNKATGEVRLLDPLENQKLWLADDSGTDEPRFALVRGTPDEDPAAVLENLPMPNPLSSKTAPDVVTLLNAEAAALREHIAEQSVELSKLRAAYRALEEEFKTAVVELYHLKVGSVPRTEVTLGQANLDTDGSISS